MSGADLAKAGHRASSAAQGFRAQTLLSFVRLKWFIRLRWYMLIFCAAALALDRSYAGMPVRPARLYLALGLLAAVNFVWVLFTQGLAVWTRRASISDASALRAASAIANAQIFVDLFFLTVILRYTGGVESPLAIFYAFHMIIAAMLLSRRSVVIQAVWAVFLYASLAWGELRGWYAAHYPFLPTLPEHGRYATTGFAFLAVTLMAVGVGGILYFVTRIVRRADAHEEELARANAALQVSQARMADLQARKAQFMRTAAHQLKSPLAVLQTQLSLLRDGLVPADQVPEHYDALIRRCRTGIEQVVDLLTFARVQDAADEGPAEQAADAAEAARAVCERLGPIAREKAIRLTCDAPVASACRVFVRAVDLTDCMTNLVDNALKYTPSGGEVRVRVAQTGAAVEIEVSDTGMGMSEETRIHLFEPYRRGSEAVAAEIPGTGLGLSIVQSVVDRAGGRIDVSSRVGEGTRIRLTFPRRRHAEKSAT